MQLLIKNKIKVKTKNVIIVTGTKDDNRGPCYRAFRFLIYLNSLKLHESNVNIRYKY